MKPIYLTDRSRIVTREECERKRYLNYDLDVDGTPIGIQRRSASLPLLNGTEIHEAHAKVLAGQELESVVTEMRNRYKDAVELKGIYVSDDIDHMVREQMAMLEALLRAFVRLVLPRILAEYEVVNIEQSHDWELAPGLVQKLRFDTIVRRKADGMLAILDWKSMKSISEVWEQKLERSRQTALYTQAAEELYGEPVEMMYVGMVKGEWRKDTAKSSPWYGQRIQSTPFLYAYTLDHESFQTAYTNRKGFHKVRIYEEMPVAKWVDYLFTNEPDVVNEQFTVIPPFAPTPRQRRRVKELVIREELKFINDIGLYKDLKAKADRSGDSILLQQAEDFLDFVAAPLREESCHKYGKEGRCPFYNLCFVEGAQEHALVDGEFERREPHHSTSMEDA
jgi:hypothetical protein